jgi:hypothetical protein
MCSQLRYILISSSTFLKLLKWLINTFLITQPWCFKRSFLDQLLLQGWHTRESLHIHITSTMHNCRSGNYTTLSNLCHTYLVHHQEYHQENYQENHHEYHLIVLERDQDQEMTMRPYSSLQLQLKLSTRLVL